MSFWPAAQLEPIVREFQSSLEDLTAAPFELEHLEKFPFTIFSTNLQRYTELMDWFTGKALEPDDNAETEDYPVRINPLNGVCLKHGYALFGEIKDDGRPLVVPKLIPDVPKEQRKGAREAARAAEGTLNRILWENFSRSVFMRNGVTSQIMGGSILHLSLVPWQMGYRTIPVQIKRISPEQFVGFPLDGDEYRLSETWIVKPITRKDAETYGYTSRFQRQKFFWIEHWTPERRTFQINEKIINFSYEGKDLKGDAENEFGFVPTVYIPHIRVGAFYGESQLDPLIGLVKEMNLRWGDVGDAHNSDTHQITAIRNTNGTPQMIQIGPLRDVLDLGSGDSLIGDKFEPDAFSVRSGSSSMTTTQIQFLQELTNQFRRDASLPKVADGEDEGSQRSGETLRARMWPLQAHIDTERIYWSDGLSWLNWMMLKICQMNNLGEITEEHLQMRIRQAWASILPKDREILVTEMINRSAQDLGSRETLLEQLGDVEDLEEEIEKIKEWIEFKAKVDAEAKAKATADAQQQVLEQQQEGEMELTDKQAENQASLQKEQQAHQIRMAERQSQAAVQVAKTRTSRPAPAGKKEK